MRFEEGFEQPARGVELLLAGDAGAGTEVPVNRANGEDDFRGAIDLARGRIAAGIHKRRYLEALTQQRIHAHHRAAAARAVEAHVALAAPKVFRHLDEIEGAAIILRLDRISDLFQSSGRTVVLTGDFDAQFRVAEDGVIIHSDAAIRRDELALRRERQRIDLRRARLAAACCLIEPHEQVAQVALQLPLNAGAADEITRLVIQQAPLNIHVDAGDFIGMRGGNLLDARAADAGEEHEGRLRAVIHDDARVKLTGDVNLLLDEHLGHGEILDPAPQERLRCERGFFGRSGLADGPDARAARNPHLRFDHHRTSDLGGDGVRGFWSGCDRAARRSDAGLGQLMFSLILVQSRHEIPRNA